MKMSKYESESQNIHDFVHYKIISRHKFQKNFQEVTNSAGMVKAEQKNYVYQHLRSKKIVANIFAKIFKQPKRRINTQISEGRGWDQQKLFTMKNRSKTVMSEISRPSASLSASKKMIQAEEQLCKVQNFNECLKRFHKSMVVSKNKMNILNKFNNAVRKFEQRLPQDPGEQTRQSIEQNQKLIQLCKQDSSIENKKIKHQQRYEQIMRFSEPIIDLDVKKEFLKKKRNSEIRQNLKKQQLQAKK